MSAEENKRLVRDLYEGINRHDPAAAAAFYAIDAKNHGHTVGRDGMQKMFESLLSAFPDLTYRIEEATAEGDRVVCKVTMNGTHHGRPTMPAAFGGMLAAVPPTQKKVEVLHFHGFRLSGGQIVEHTAVRDDLGMLKQLGLVREQ